MLGRHSEIRGEPGAIGLAGGERGFQVLWQFLGPVVKADRRVTVSVFVRASVEQLNER